MKWRQRWSMGWLVMLAGFSAPAPAADSAALGRLNQFREQRDSLYAHMKRYGINRESVAAMRRLYEMSPPYSDPHVSLASEKLLSPGEHYRIEMDEFILTTKVPDGQPVPGSWIWPYTNTRTPDPAMEKLLVQEKGALKVANLGWYVCRSIFPPGLVGRCEVMGVSMTYRVLKPEEIDKFSTPEKTREVFSEVQRGRVPSENEIREATRDQLIDNRIGNRIVLKPEPVVINGRIWMRQAMSSSYDLTYLYTTILHPGRMLVASFGLPASDRDVILDPSSRTATVNRAFVLMEEMLPSLRIAKVNDDGSPDAFVIERVEPAPLPVRENLPTVH